MFDINSIAWRSSNIFHTISMSKLLLIDNDLNVMKWLPFLNLFLFRKLGQINPSSFSILITVRIKIQILVMTQLRRWFEARQLFVQVIIRNDPSKCPSKELEILVTFSKRNILISDLRDMISQAQYKLNDPSCDIDNFLTASTAHMHKTWQYYHIFVNQVAALFARPINLYLALAWGHLWRGTQLG